MLFSALFEESGKLKAILRMEEALLRGYKKRMTVESSALPDDGEWLEWHLDEALSKEEILDIFDKSYRYVLNGCYTKAEDGYVLNDGEELKKYEAYAEEQINRMWRR